MGSPVLYVYRKIHLNTGTSTRHALRVPFYPRSMNGPIPTFSIRKHRYRFSGRRENFHVSSRGTRRSPFVRKILSYPSSLVLGSGGKRSGVGWGGEVTSEVKRQDLTCVTRRHMLQRFVQPSSWPHIVQMIPYLYEPKNQIYSPLNPSPNCRYPSGSQPKGSLFGETSNLDSQLRSRTQGRGPLSVGAGTTTGRWSLFSAPTDPTPLLSELVVRWETGKFRNSDSILGKIPLPLSGPGDPCLGPGSETRKVSTHWTYVGHRLRRKRL